MLTTRVHTELPHIERIGVIKKNKMFFLKKKTMSARDPSGNLGCFDATCHDEAGKLSLLIFQICKVWHPIKIKRAVKWR